ncbi:MAG: hypothetical protein K8I82_10105 [Anaerolineae bacterium]|nr:hypothetical protein [Anaerolineae bacterium]
MTIADIVQQAKYLSHDERKALVKQLIDLLDEPVTKMHDILEFEGIAAHLADDEDPQDTINRMRDEWDSRL